METTSKIPVWFWVVSALALAWNILGVGAFFAQIGMTEEALAALPEAERNAYANLPSWYTIIFGIAVIGSAVGSLLLLLKKKLAYPVLLISLIAVIIQMSYVTFSLKMANAMTPMIVIVALFLVWFAKNGIKKGWLK